MFFFLCVWKTRIPTQLRNTYKLIEKEDQRSPIKRENFHLLTNSCDLIKNPKRQR